MISVIQLGESVFSLQPPVDMNTQFEKLEWDTVREAALTVNSMAVSVKKSNHINPSGLMRFCLYLVS